MLGWPGIKDTRIEGQRGETGNRDSLSNELDVRVISVLIVLDSPRTWNLRFDGVSDLDEAERSRF